tara:strand:- start:2220 stop:3113 length:894 start_codon:yes stop_codon:yes gene_type:complete
MSTPSPPSHTRAGRIRLSDWAHLKTELYWVYQGSVLPEFRKLPKIDYVGRSAYFIKKGSLWVETENGEVTAQANEWIVPGQGITQRKFSSDAEIISIRFTCDWPDGHSCFDSDIALLFTDKEFPKLRQELDSLIQIVNQTVPNADRLAALSRGDLIGYLQIRGRFIEWLASLIAIGMEKGAFVSQFDTMSGRVFEAARILDRFPLDETFTNEDLATSVSLGAHEVVRLFKAEFGKSPRKYLDQRRLHAAESQLRGTSMPIKQIAFDLGFSTLSYFSRWFHKKTGRYPREFRNSTRGQ